MIPAEPRSCAAPLKPLAALPLDHFGAAHRRQRLLCLALMAATRAPVPSARALCALAIELVEDLQCLEAAEKLLFELLRRRAEPEDDIARVLGILTNDHAAGRDLAVELAAVLCDARASQRETADLATLVERFVARRLGNIALENAVVLPIARLRLTAADLDQLSASIDKTPRPAAPDRAADTLFESE